MSTQVILDTARETETNREGGRDAGEGEREREIERERELGGRKREQRGGRERQFNKHFFIESVRVMKLVSLQIWFL